MNTEVENSNINDALVLTLTAQIVSSFLSHTAVSTDKLPEVITTVHSTLAGLQNGKTEVEEEPQPQPAVNPKKSIQADYIICLEDGKKFKSLKRHLMTHYGLTPEQYRAKWGLNPDYPMVAPNYAAERSRLAKSLGLGRKRAAEGEAAAEAAQATARRKQKKAADAA